MSGFVKMATLLGFIALLVVSVQAATSIETVQRGYDGVGMEHVATEDALTSLEKANAVQPAFPAANPDGPRAAEAYENVQVLGHLSTGQFTRLMVALTQWVAAEQGCNYCHIPTNLASDEIYTKVVSRRMIEMTMHINENWSSHVQQTGVVCYTCHRGLNVPPGIWFKEKENEYAQRMVGNNAGQNYAAESVAYASLPSDPFSPYLSEASNIRVASTTALPTGNRSSIKQAEWTYGLMMHFSEALGVNCTYCHNSRSWGAWDQSPVARTVAWHGIRMVRDLNANYLTPLGPAYPEHRLGPTGDAPKANCKTCHYGAYKPLLGAPLLKDYPSLAKAVKYVPPPPPEAPVDPTANGTSPAETESAP